MTEAVVVLVALVAGHAACVPLGRWACHRDPGPLRPRTPAE
ncbi:hypothetical protein [Streptomyces sp. NPDC050145]